jgi:hypothetical protein
MFGMGGADKEAFAELERQDKQNYLKTEVMDLGYDVNWFSEYMGQKRPGGTDVDEWTFDELKGVVKDFQDMVAKDYPNYDQN